MRSLPHVFSKAEARRSHACRRLGPWGAQKALRANKSWPTQKRAAEEAFEPLDVDRYGDLGFVVASHEGRLRTYWFVDRSGRWEYYGGGGTGGSGAFERSRRSPIGADRAIWCSQGGSSGRMRNVVVRCIPDVQIVTVERPEGIRRGDVSAGPGCVGIIWSEEIDPVVKAFSSAGAEIGSVAVGDFNRHPVGMEECACPTCLHGRLYVPRELIGPMHKRNFIPDGFEAQCQPFTPGGSAFPNCGLWHRCVKNGGWVQVPGPES